MAKQKNEVVAKAAAKKPVAKTTEEKKPVAKTTEEKKPVAKTTEETNQWNDLEKKLNGYQVKFKDNGYNLNQHVNPLVERFEVGERSEALISEIEKLEKL